MDTLDLQIMAVSLTVITSVTTLFILMAGFSLLEAGSVRSKSASSILLKNLVNVVLGLTGFFILGGGIFVGKSWRGFIGTDYFLYLDIGKDESGEETDVVAVSLYTFVLFTITASTIMSGAIAERANIWSYCFWAFLSSLFFHPLLMHWAWNADGWLAKFGFVDVAGSGIVHLYGATSSLVAVILLGPRIGRIDEINDKFQKKVDNLVGHSTVLSTLGAILLFFGFFGFNGASSLLATIGNRPVYFYALTSINTSLAAAFGCLTALILVRITQRRWSLVEANLGLLNGCVSICGVCGFVSPWAAPFFGIAASLSYFLLKMLLLMFKLDDTLVAVPVHGGSGFAGLFVTSIFYSNPITGVQGLIYGHGALFYKQLVGVVVIVVYTTVTTFLVLFPLKYFNILRISAELESEGLDKRYLKEPAYPEIYAKGDFIKFREYLHAMQGYNEFQSDTRGFNMWKEKNGSSGTDKTGSHTTGNSRGGGGKSSRKSQDRTTQANTKNERANSSTCSMNETNMSLFNTVYDGTVIEVEDDHDAYNEYCRSKSSSTMTPAPHLQSLDNVDVGL